MFRDLPTIYFLVLEIFICLNYAAGQADDLSGNCVCNPEDNNTGPVCANNGVTFTSACDFRLKQGLKADLGIRCVGECPCDDTMLGLGIDCRTSVAASSTTPGLEFCGTNSVTYNSENMFMCDQVQDPALAIACPGTCPCQLSDCPRLFTPPPTTAKRTTASSTRVFSPSINATQIIATSLPAIGFAQAIPSLVQHVKATPPPFAPNWQAFPPPTPTPLSMPAFFQQPLPSLKQQASPPTQQAPWQPPLSLFGSELAQQPSLNMIQDARQTKSFNPLAEALRSVPFRLFRHLYIAISVAAEGMKQIPMQIAKNMQSRLPPYVREVPVQLAEAIQEAMSIHFDSLARQVKETVDAVRAVLDQDNM